MNRYKPKILKRTMCLLSTVTFALLLSAFSEEKTVNTKANLAKDDKVNPEKLGHKVACGSVTKIYVNDTASDIKLRIYVTDRCQDRESSVKIFDKSNELVMHFMVGYKKVKSRTVLVPPNGYVNFECNGNKPKKNAFLYKCTYQVTEVP